MKIRNVAIEQFGVWKGLQLPLKRTGLSVFYGPNEAGKTTLMRFLQWMLYNGPADVAGPVQFLPGNGWSSRRIGLVGSLDIESDCEPLTISRVCAGPNEQSVTLHHDHQVLPSEDLAVRILHGIPESTFSRVFCLGLHELQELATLEAEEVADYVYHASLGPEGQRLLDLTRRIQDDRESLIGNSCGPGTLVQILKRRDQLNVDLQNEQERLQRHERLWNERCRQEDAIASLEERQAGIRSQLRGHEHLNRVWRPWVRLQESEEEYNSLSAVTEFPRDGLSRLDDIDAEIKAAAERRKSLQSQMQDLRRQAAENNSDSRLRRHMRTIQGLIDQVRWFQALEERIAESELEVEETHRRLKQQLLDLGNEWTIDRLASLDTSPSAQLRILESAQGFQRSLGKRARLRRYYERTARTCQRRTNKLNDRLKELGDQSVQDALEREKRVLRQLHELGSLRLRAGQLREQQTRLANQLQRLDTRWTLPRWSYVIFAAFVVVGLGLAGFGLWTGVATNVVAGAVYALLGAASGGLAWAFQAHFERELERTTTGLRDEQFDVEIRLRETQHAIDAFELELPVRTDAELKQDVLEIESGLPEEALIATTVLRLTELEKLAVYETQIQTIRRRLSKMRSRMQEAQRTVSDARQAWCQALTQAGLTESVQIREAFATWHRVLQSLQNLQAWRAAQATLQERQREWDGFRQRVEELGRRLQYNDLDYTRPVDVLRNWESHLQDCDASRKERRRIDREVKRLRKTARRQRRDIDELSAKRSALLIQGGASTREEFEYREMCYRRRGELHELMAAARRELDEATSAESELAIVEEDLRAFDPTENEECICVLQSELSDIQRELQQGFEHLGQLKHEIHGLENDRRSADLRLEQAQVRDALKVSTESWLGLELAATHFEEIRTRFERECQPETLQVTAQYLQRLSGGRYANVWTTLDDRRIYVDDAQGQTFVVEQLSGGTREQLLLALRFALLDRFANEGIVLPVILDDILVNFDQDRTEAAINELTAWSQQDRQVLFFTCHLHLAQAFQRHAVELIHLPPAGTGQQERKAG